MKEDMLEVLMYLFENYMVDDFSFSSDQDEIVMELVGAGFESDEVDKAFVWLEGLLHICDRAIAVKSNNGVSASIRHFTVEEADRLKIEGQSLLFRLANAGILDQYSREAVIDRVMALDSGNVDIDHIKWVILMVLSNHPSGEDTSLNEYEISEDLILVLH